ncbi:MAG: sigma-70 family RNA polymerase sigma factor [Planctomycetota bacterium]
MKDASTRLFLRYRDHRDGAALARLLDRVGPGMMAVALRLTPDAAGAEDLVQSTFVVALEKPEAFDPSRRVEPWLYGILARHAARARREAARREPDARLRALATDAEAPPAPLDHAERSEVASRVDRALESLPAHYRSVLTPFLLEGLSATDIAGRDGESRSAGHIRVQIGRGLALLRRRLPAGLAHAGAVAALGVGGGRRAFGGVRDALLTRYAPAQASLTATGLVGPVASLLLMKKLLLAAGVLAGLAAVLVLQQRDPSAPTTPTDDHLAARETPDSGSAADVLESVPVERGTERVALESAPAAEEVEPAAAPEETVEDPLAAEAEVGTAELLVVVTDSDGVVVPGARVRARPLSEQHLLILMIDELEGPIRTAEAGPDGRATVTGLGEGQHAIEVAADGFATTWAILTPQLQPASSTELTVSLEPEAILEGVVRDGEGRPVEGTRVFIALELFDGRSFNDRWSADTGPDGRYRIGSVSYGEIEVRATSRFGQSASTEIDFEVGGTVTWDPVLAEPDPVTGVLLDADGEPRSDWWVRGHDVRNVPEDDGDENPRGLPGSWSAAAMTDADGRFVLRGLEDDALVLSAQASSEWRADEPFAVFDEIDRAASPLVLRLPRFGAPAVVRGAVAPSGGANPTGLRLALVDPRLVADRERELGADGAFEFTVVVAEGETVPVDLQVRIGESTVVASRTFDLAAGDDVDLGVWDVEAPGRIRIEPTGTDGYESQEVIWILRAMGETSSRVDHERLTANGAAERAMVAGTYQLFFFSCSTHRAESIDFVVEEGRTTVVRPEMVSALRFTYRFEDADGNDIDSEIRFRISHPESGLELHDVVVPPGETVTLEVEPLDFLLLKATAADGREAAMEDVRRVVDDGKRVLVLR